MKTILLIEDNNDMRENIAEILELSDYNVLCAENGKIGVALAQKHQPDLILCDVMMPELDGFGVLHILSKSTKTNSIPFIFLTAKSEKSDFRKGMSLGADDYLTKPFDDTELLNAIELRLKKSAFVQTPFENTTSGLNAFINEVRGKSELEKLSEDRELRTYQKKELIFEEDSYPRYLFMINTGKVKTVKVNDYGKEYIIDLYGPGDFIGYLDLFKSQKYHDSAYAMEQTELVLIPKDDFFSLINSDRDVSTRFIKLMANNLMDKEEQLLHLAYDSVRKRVAEALLRLRTRYQNQENPEDHFTMSILRDDLASMVGTAKETVIRTLTDFKEEGIINIKASKITIIKADVLEEMPN